MISILGLLCFSVMRNFKTRLTVLELEEHLDPFQHLHNHLVEVVGRIDPAEEVGRIDHPVVVVARIVPVEEAVDRTDLVVVVGRRTVAVVVGRIAAAVVEELHRKQERQLHLQREPMWSLWRLNEGTRGGE